jgi:MoaA/NifB/PqqE/SkfB family radical SAM enzyme
MDQLRKIYIEPTSRCNLDCAMCARHTWTDEETGDMSRETFGRILDAACKTESVETLFFGGVAEPFSHPDILWMLGEAKATGRRVEAITNGAFLDTELMQALVDMDLDLLWISVDREHGEPGNQGEPGDSGDDLSDLQAKLRRFYGMAYKAGAKTRAGIVHVATRRNIHALPEVLALANNVRAAALMVTNLIPFDKSMEGEILYNGTLKIMGHADNIAHLRREQGTAVSLPIMDFGQPEVSGVLPAVMAEAAHLSLGSGNVLRRTEYCPFVGADSLYVRWDGDVAPCVALLHNNRYWLSGTERHIRRCAFGNLAEADLGSIWDSPDYRDFRRKVREFHFSPCTICGHCSYVEGNEEDCYGNTFPTCGGCLWAEGLIQCP